MNEFPNVLHPTSNAGVPVGMGCRGWGVDEAVLSNDWPIGSPTGSVIGESYKGLTGENLLYFVCDLLGRNLEIIRKLYFLNSLRLRLSSPSKKHAVSLWN